MSGPFNVGDVVVCVDARVNPTWGRESLVKGRHYRVRAVGEARFNRLIGRIDGSIHVHGADALSPWGFGAFRFQHLPKADEQFTAQIRACKPIRKQVDA